MLRIRYTTLKSKNVMKNVMNALVWVFSFPLPIPSSSFVAGEIDGRRPIMVISRTCRGSAVGRYPSHCQSNDGSRNVNSVVECGPNLGKRFRCADHTDLHCFPALFTNKYYGIYRVLIIACLYNSRHFIETSGIIVYPQINRWSRLSPFENNWKWLARGP